MLFCLFRQNPSPSTLVVDYLRDTLHLSGTKVRSMIPVSFSFLVLNLPILSVVIKWRSATSNKQVGLIYLVFYKIQIGCSEGGCGACTVMVSTWDDVCNVVKNIPVNSCLRPLCSLDGSAITTVEGESLLHTNGTRFLVCIFIPLYHVLVTIFLCQESVIRKPCIPCKKPWPNIMEHSVVFVLRDGWWTSILCCRAPKAN